MESLQPKKRNRVKNTKLHVCDVEKNIIAFGSFAFVVASIAVAVGLAFLAADPTAVAASSEPFVALGLWLLKVVVLLPFLHSDYFLL